jgi:NhaP-type Na+/H+ or K+/H+ antiporter
LSEHVLINLAGLVILGIGAQWLAWRLRYPSILFLLIFGFLAGPLTGFLDPDQLMGNMLLPFVTLAVAVILFEGGLTLNIKEFREIGRVVILLISVGVLVTGAIIALAAFYILGLNIEISILLGAILVVTGPTVVGPLLRHIKPNSKVNDILKWEGIVIDPIGALLAVLVFDAIIVGSVQQATTAILISLSKTIFFGGLSGFFFAWLLVLLIRKYWVPDFLQETVTLSMVIASYLVSDLIQPESGLFSVTLMGIIMANQKYVSVKHILEFKENLRVLIISVLFIILSARLQLDSFKLISGSIVYFMAVLLFLARPLSVFISTIRSGLSIREKLFLSWVAPRGIVAAAVASIFALRLSDAGIENSEVLIPITFTVIVVTVVVYGLSSAPVARLLKVSESNSQGVLIVGAHPWALEIAKMLKNRDFSVVMVDTNRRDIAKARLAGIKTVYGSILSEQVIENLHLGGIGKLIALTSNDEVNSLAVLHFSELIDREELYQISPFKSEKGKEKQFSPKHLRGRFIFGDEVSYSDLRTHFYSGAVIKSTKLTKDFTFEDFKEHYQKRAIPLFAINENKELSVFTTDKTLKPKANHTIIAMAFDDKTKDAK